MYWDWADRPPLPPPRQTGGDSRRFWQDLQITAFLRGLAVHWRLAGTAADTGLAEPDSRGELRTTDN